MVKKFLSLILLVICSSIDFCTEDALDYWNMNLDGQAIVEPSGHSYTFGNTPYHSRYTASDIQLPFKEVLTLPVGKTAAQPVILDGRLILMAGNGIKVISLKEKTVIQSLQLQFYKTADPSDYDSNHQFKASNSQITHIPNQTGWWHPDKTDRLICGTRDGLLYSLKFSHGVLEKEWCFEGGKGTRYRSTPLFFFDRITKSPYLVISSLNHNVYILNQKGKLLKTFKENGEISSSPMVYPDITGSKIFDRFIIGVDSGYGKNGGYISSYYATNSMFHPSRTFNQQLSKKFSFSGIPASMASRDIGKDILIFLSDKEGHLYCFSEATGALLWQIDRYVQLGKLTINNTPSVDDNHVYFTLTNYKGKAHLVAINYAKACQIAKSKNNPKSVEIEQAIEMEGGDYTGITYSGTAIAKVFRRDDKGTQTVQKILITSNLNEQNTSTTPNQKPNLFAYYAQKQDGNRLLPVKDAFLTPLKDGSLQLSDHLALPGGIVSEPTVTDNHLAVVDGQGTLHVYTSAFEKNLAVTRLTTDTVPIVKGKTQVLTATVHNFSDESLVCDIDLSAGDQVKHFESVKIPPKGTSLNFSFKVPVNFKEKQLPVSCAIDPNCNLASETNRTDNFRSAQIPIQPPTDLAVTVPSGSYETNKWVTTAISVQNTSDLPLKNIPFLVKLNDQTVGQPSLLQLPAKAITKVPVKWLTPNKPGKATLQACVDVTPETTNTVVEENEQNNRATAVYSITNPNVDLAVTHFSTTKVLAETWIVHQVRVTNHSDESFVSGNKAKVNLQIGANTMSTLTELEAGETKVVPFIWKSPVTSNKGNLSVSFTATINPDRRIKEYAATGDVWANNQLKGTFTVMPKKATAEIIADKDGYTPMKPPPGCENATVKWIESRFDHTETRITGYDVDTYETEVTRANGSTSTVTHHRRTPIYKDFDVFKDWDFMTQLSLECSATPSKLKSGYGFELNCKTTTTTDYDHLERLSGAQHVYAYFPEDQYTTPVPLISRSDSKSLSNNWYLPVNTKSVLMNSNHYVPVWFPNGSYIIKIVATDQTSPGGNACTTKWITLDISGNMYEDDYSTVNKN